MDTDNTLFQRIMNRAYDRYQGHHWTKEQFWDQCSALEQIAVACGNFNYQIGNGGFDQWHGNGYDTPKAVATLQRTFTEIDTPEAQQTLELLNRFTELLKTYPEDDCEDDFEEWSRAEDLLCREYYAINEKLIEQIDQYLHECVAKMKDELVELAAELSQLDVPAKV